MKYKPNILKSFSDSIQTCFEDSTEGRYRDKTDKLILEDLFNRIYLIGQIRARKFITGIVVAIRGIEKESSPGKFCVSKICPYKPYSPSPLADAPLFNDHEKNWIALVSGFDLFFSKADSRGSSTLVKLHLLVNYLSGFLDDIDIPIKARNICRLIICGNSLSKENVDKGFFARQVCRYLKCRFFFIIYNNKKIIY
jgi:hypothetical protein